VHSVPEPNHDSNDDGEEDRLQGEPHFGEATILVNRLIANKIDISMKSHAAF